ncbi:MAG: methyl-accepting chemotaxis protein [Defluviitaleaceae bacterium]|nr:methyl-accepting chemotaxis protein [Defluviitaleaceae bacterium]
MNLRKDSISLATKITLMVLLIILLATIPIGIFAVRVYQRDSIELHRARAIGMAQGLAALIDPDEFLLAMETGEKNEHYMELQHQFNQAHVHMGTFFMFAGVADESIGFTAFMEALAPGQPRTVDLWDVIPNTPGMWPPVFFAAQRGTAGATEIHPTGVDDNYVVGAYAPIFDRNGMPIGLVGVNILASEVFANSNAFAITITIIVALVILVLIWIPIFWVRKYVGIPLSRLCQVSDNIAKGNMNVNIPDTSSNDEIGKLAQSFRWMSKEISSVIYETQRRSKAIISGHIQAEHSGYSAKGDFKKITDSLENVAEGVFQYLHKLPAGVILFDDEYRFGFINAFNEGLGYDPKVMLGKPFPEIMPAAQAEFLLSKFNEARSTGKLVSYPIEMGLPGGDFVYAAHNIIPINDNNGNVAGFMHFGYDTTEAVSTQKRSDKINDYQEQEVSGIIETLQEGLEKGILKFAHKPQIHDKDTVEIAETFNKIGNTMEYALGGIKEYVDEISHLLKEFSNKNFDVTTKQNYVGDFATIKQSVDGVIHSISSLVSDIQNVTAQVETGAGQISLSTQELMASFEEQAAVMSEVREAVSILTEKTQRNAADAQSANGLSEQVQDVANKGSQHMKDMSTVMEEIKMSSAEIAKVASIIEGIAFQTNLLALNASVEAARAGDHGKGFAVVAEEVRNLAGRSSEAAKSTSEMIAKSLGRVDEGVIKSIETTEALQKIVEVTASVTEVISNIANVSNEQAEEISKIQDSMEELYRGSSDNTSAVQNNASVSEELSSQANMLMSLVDRFKIGK